jgi:hypothetical protein
MLFIKLLLVFGCIFFQSEILPYQQYEQIVNQQAHTWVQNVYAELPSEQQLVLYNLVLACADFSEVLAAITKLNSLLIVQSAKIQGITLRVIETNESLTENVVFLRSLSDSLVKTTQQYEEQLTNIENIYQFADPIVRDIFKELCNSIYSCINQNNFFSGKLEKMNKQDVDVSVEHIKTILTYTNYNKNDHLHFQIIDKQSYLTTNLYKQATISWEIAQLYFDMLNMYVSILDTYGIAINRI